MERNYYKQDVALRETRKEKVYRYDKSEGLERRFWCKFHEDFYSSVVMRKSRAPIVHCKYVDWKYYENMKDPFFNEAMAKCKEMGLYDIMGFRYDWNEEILGQFHSSLYYDENEIAFYWTTEGVRYGVDYMTFSRLLGLGTEDEKRDPIHVEEQLKTYQVPTLFYNPICAQEGKANHLLPVYYAMNQFFRATIDAKDGDPVALRYYAVNLLARTLPSGRPFCIMDFIWNELRRTMIEAKKSLPAAPYIMYMIERVTKVTFPKTVKHEPLHLRARSGDAPPLPPAHAGATRNPRHDPAPSSVGASSSSRHRHHDSFVKRALRSIFGMCRNIANDVHENSRSINEIRGHLGLPLDPHRELPAFDDPFVEWDAADEASIAATHAPLPRARRQPRSPRRRTSSSRRAPPSGQEIFDEDEETEEDEPLGYREHPDSDEDEDTSEDAAQDENDE